MNNYISIYQKIGIYNRNLRYNTLHECHKYSTNIYFTQKDKESINEILCNLREYIIEQYINENVLSSLKTVTTETLQKIVQKGIEKIPNNIKQIYIGLSNLMEQTTLHVKQFIDKVAALLCKLGDTLSDIFDKLGFYTDEVIKLIGSSNNSPTDKLLSKNNNKSKFQKFIIQNVSAGIQNKDIQSQLNEGKIAKAAAVGGAIAVSQLSILPVALLAGGYISYKTLKLLGPKLSDKLEPILLSDKSKKFVSKLADNPVSKYGLGLSKSLKKDENESKLQYAGKVFKSILINLVISVLITKILALFITTIFFGGSCTVMCSIVIAALLAARNITKIIMNRILNMNTNNKDKQFFDVLTLVGILSSLGSVVVQIPEIKEWLSNIVNGLQHTSTSQSASALNKINFQHIDAATGNFNGKFNINAFVGGYVENGVSYYAVMEPNSGRFYKSIVDEVNGSSWYKEPISVSDLDGATKKELLIVDYYDVHTCSGKMQYTVNSPGRNIHAIAQVLTLKSGDTVLSIKCDVNGKSIIKMLNLNADNFTGKLSAQEVLNQKDFDGKYVMEKAIQVCMKGNKK